MKQFLAGAALFLAALVSTAVPALASAHTPFAVTDNGGVLVTHHLLAKGQAVYSGGVARTVESVRGDIITLTPGLPASDKGKTVTFST